MYKIQFGGPGRWRDMDLLSNTEEGALTEIKQRAGTFCLKKDLYRVVKINAADDVEPVKPANYGSTADAGLPTPHRPANEATAPTPAADSASPGPDVTAQAHYKALSPEPIVVIESWGLDKDFYLANAIKYIARAGRKGAAEPDIAKAISYLTRKLNALRGKPSW